jgi:hypothetical protein
MSLLGSSLVIPLGDFSTVYQCPQVLLSSECDCAFAIAGMSPHSIRHVHAFMFGVQSGGDGQAGVEDDRNHDPRQSVMLNNSIQGVVQTYEATASAQQTREPIHLAEKRPFSWKWCTSNLSTKWQGEGILIYMRCARDVFGAGEGIGRDGVRRRGSVLTN